MIAMSNPSFSFPARCAPGAMPHAGLCSGGSFSPGGGDCLCAAGRRPKVEGDFVNALKYHIVWFSSRRHESPRALEPRRAAPSGPTAISRIGGGEVWSGRRESSTAQKNAVRSAMVVRSSTAISQSAASSTAARCASEALRNVWLSSVRARPCAGFVVRLLAERAEPRDQFLAPLFERIVAVA